MKPLETIFDLAVRAPCGKRIAIFLRDQDVIVSP